MRQFGRAALCALMFAAALAPAQAADRFHRARHAYPHAYQEWSHGVWRWVKFPGTAYAPISPMDYSLPNGELWSRSLEPWPWCCSIPTYSPVYFP
jgi:hypothetical protein